MDSQALEVITGVTVVAAVAYLLKLIFEFIISVKSSSTKPNSRNSKALSHEDYEKLMDVVAEVENLDLKNLEAQQRDLWIWHNEKDDDGVPRWYVRKSLEESIKRQNKILSELTKAVDKLACNSTTQAEVLNRLVGILTNSR